MSNHTPGPWTHLRMKLGPKQKDRRCGFVINGPDTSEPLPVRVCDLRVPAGSGGFGEGKANARLIAAAPELLVAATFADDEIGKHMAAIEAGEYSAQQIVEILCDIQNAARAAIAKATGEILEDNT